MSVFSTGRTTNSPETQDAMGVPWQARDGNAHRRSSNPRSQPPPRKTQKQQDDEDEKARKKAKNELVQSWNDRLQLISVITTFFGATEAQLISSTVPNDPSQPSSMAQTAANAGLSGALILHLYAAVVSFLAAFVLIRFRLKEAKKEEHKANPERPTSHDGEEKQLTLPAWYSADPHVECTAGYFRLEKEPPTHLLERCHTLCVACASLGFVLAAVGILCFLWSSLPKSVGIFSSACLAVCIVAGVGVVGVPSRS